MPRRNDTPAVPAPLLFLWDWPLERVAALHRAAKTTPFFRDPKAMMALRHVLETRNRTERGSAA